ncbi:MAG: glycosyltransferase family 4 protein [Candidatus Binatia bacterium]
MVARGWRAAGQRGSAPPRIVLDGLPLQVQSAGIAVYTGALVRALAAQHPEVEFGLFGLRWPLARDDSAAASASFPPNVRWLPSLVYPLVAGAPIMRMPRLLSAEAALGPAALYHATNYAAPRTRRTPLVVTVHDLALLRFPELGTPGLRQLIARVPRTVHAAQRVIADSHATAQDLRELLGVPAQRIRVVHLGCDERFQPVPDSPARQAVLARYGIAPPYLLHVGTIEPRKNLPLLVRACARLRDQRGAPLRLVLVGHRGWGYDALQRALAAEGARVRVDILGRIAAADLPAVYSAAELLAYPSLYEGFGLPVLEAMACGTPVVTSAAGSLAEIAGDAARYVDPRDPDALAAVLAEVLGDTAQRRILSERGRARAARFSWERCARETFAVYEELVPFTR